MIATALLLVVLGLDGTLGVPDGSLLLGLMVAYTAFLVVQSRAEPAQGAVDEFEANLAPSVQGRWHASLWVQIGLIAAGLALLVFGSDALVTSAVSFARAWGVSETVIGLTIVAAGTSLPEVATSVMASVKGERDIAVGNVVGSGVYAPASGALSDTRSSRGGMVLHQRRDVAVQLRHCAAEWPSDAALKRAGPNPQRQ